MNETMHKRHDRSGKGKSAQAGSGQPSAGLVIGTFLVGVVLLGYVLMRGKPAPQQAVPPQPEGQKAATQAPAAPTAARSPEGWRPVETRPPSAPAPAPTTAAPVASAPATPQPLPTVSAKDLVARFDQFATNNAPINASQANQIDQTIKQLIAQGPSSIPAIAEHLAKLQDVNLEGHSNLLKFPSLRAGLIDALHQIGGGASTELMAKTLQSTADPFEIGLLGKYLEQQAPGQYKNDVVNAARDALKMASQDQLGGRDVGPLFQVLQKSEDADVSKDIEATGNKWNYYAVMSMAALPNGAGVDSLINKVQDPQAANTTEGRFIWQMLAQLSAEYPQARAALLAQAQAGTIPESAWPKIAGGLAGDQYQFGDSRLKEIETPTQVPGLKTYHIQSGNQNFYSLPIGASGAEDVAEKQAIIDGLLNANIPQSAKDALQAGRTSLGALKASK